MSPTIDTASLDARGYAVATGLFDATACRALRALWADEAAFRNRIVMQNHGYGQGEYRYFQYPLPEPVARLREALYPSLAAVANRWNESLGKTERYPPDLRSWLELCHAAGQNRPTPLLSAVRP